MATKCLIGWAKYSLIFLEITILAISLLSGGVHHLNPLSLTKSFFFSFCQLTGNKNASRLVSKPFQSCLFLRTKV
jgi:hypothetical protein